MGAQAIPKGKPEENGAARYPVWKIIVAALGVVGGIAIWAWFPRASGLSENGIIALAVLWFMVMWWIADIVHILVTGLVGLALLMLLNVAPLKTLFSGFADTTTVFLVFAFGLAAAVSKTGLGKRIAYALMARVRPAYGPVLLTYSIVSIILGALIPSGSARTVLLGTIGLMLLPVFGQSEEGKSNVGRGIFTLLGLTGYLGSNAYLTGGASIILTVGLLAKAGVHLTYLQWLVMAGPAVLIMAILLALIIPRIFPPEVRTVDEERLAEFRGAMKSLGPMSREERITAVVMALVVLFWVIGDYIGIGYVTVGLLGLVILMLPVLKVIDVKDFNSKVAWETIYFVGIAVTLGSVLDATGVSAWLAKITAPVLSSGSLTAFSIKLWALATIAHFVLPSSLPAFAALMPVIMASAKAQGFSVVIPIMVFALSYTGIVLIYQMVHSVIAYGFHQFEPKDFIKPGLVMIVLWLILTPLQVWYLSVLGY